MELLAVSRFGSTFKFSPNSSNSSSGFTVSEVATDLSPEEQKEKAALEATQKALAAFDTVYDFQNGTREGSAPIYQGLLGHLNATEKMIFEKMPNKTIGRVNLQKELAECRKIVKSLIKSTEPKAPSRIRSFMTKQAGRIGLATALFSQGGYVAADTVNKIDTAANLTAPADKNRNTASLMNAVQETTAFQLNDTKKTPMELRLNESINGPGMKLAQNNLGNQFASGSSTSGYSVNPSETGFGATAFVQESGYRLEASLMSAISGTSDTRAKASLAMLAEGAKLGTFIEVEVGTEIHRLAVAESAVIGGTKVKLSMGLLRRIMETGFAQYTQDTFKPEMSQRSVGIDVSREFDHALLKELTGSIQWYSVDNVNLGKIATFVSDTATDYRWADVYGGVRGGTKVVASLTATLKLSENVKLDASAGAEQVNYNAFLGNEAKTTTGGVGRLDLTVRPDNRNQLKFSAGADSNSQIVAIEYARKLNNNLEAFVEASHTKNTGGLPDADRIFAGIRGTFGGGKNSGNTSNFSPLFKDYKPGNTTLSYGDLRANQQVATDQIQVHEAVTGLDTIVYIDKTKGAAGDGLDLNNDKTLASLHLDNGGFSVTGVAGVSDMRYMQYLSVVGGKLAIVNFRGLNAQMAAEGLQKGQTKTLQISVNDTSGNGMSIYSVTITKGSAEFVNAVARLFNITPEQAAAFIAGTKTMDQIRLENIDTPTVNAAPTVTVSLDGITVTNNIRDIDGLKSLSYSLYAADGVTLVKTNTTGVFTAADGVLPGTSYIVKTTASTLNNATKQYTLTVSPGVGVTTPLIDHASTVNAPAGTSTDTTVTETNNITDIDGVRNITYYLYQSDGTTLVGAPNTTGSFTGLTPSTTYKMKTTAETLNPATKVWSLQTSPLASIITTAAPVIVTDHASVVTAPTGVATNTSITETNTIADSDGVRNITYYLYQSNGTTLVGAPNNTGSFTGLTASTTYKMKTTAETFNPVTNTWTLQTSPLATLATLATPPVDTPSTVTAPTGVSTATTITETNTIADTDGVRNITYYLYQSDGTTLVGAPNNTGSFTGLTASTTYKMKTTAETLNAATSTWVLQTSPLATLATSAAPDVTPPSTPTISINSGATVTNSTSVSLALGGTDNVGVTGWFVSESSSTPALGSFVGSAPTSFTLSAGDGSKTIYVWSRDAAGNISAVGSSTITLDTVVNTSSTANLTAQDEGTAISQTLTFGEAVKVISGNNIGGAVIGTTGSYSTTVNVTGTAGAFGLYSGNITVQDAAGNQKVINVSILLNQVI